MLRLSVASLALLAACNAQTAPENTQKVPERSEPQVTDSAPTGACHADAAQFAVNQSYTEALAEQAREAAGAAVVRQLVPGQMVTMEYRADRLNLELTGDGKVAKVRCG